MLSHLRNAQHVRLDQDTADFQAFDPVVWMVWRQVGNKFVHHSQAAARKSAHVTQCIQLNVSTSMKQVAQPSHLQHQEVISLHSETHQKASLEFTVSQLTIIMQARGRS